MQRTLLSLVFFALFGSATAADQTARSATAATPMPRVIRIDNAAPEAIPLAHVEEEIDIDDEEHRAPILAPGEAEDAHRELNHMREQMRELSRKMAELSMKLGDVGPRAYAFRYLGDPDRAMIGIVMGTAEHGVRITGLTPGGPADKAGVKSNDVIVAINGQTVDDGDKSSPEKRVASAMQLLSGLKTGQEIKLTLLHEGKKSDFTVKAERREAFNWQRVIAGEGDAPMPPGFDREVQVEVHRALHDAKRELHDAGHNIHSIQAMRMMMPSWNLNLASMNPELGSYFGSDKGVLVVSIGKDIAPALKSGDVLLEVAGTPVTQPEEAMRLVHDQASGSEIQLKVLRQHKELKLSMKAPAFKGLFIPTPPLAPPAPPAPPALPAPATPPPGHAQAAPLPTLAPLPANESSDIDA